MTVSEFIEKLKEFPPDSKVVCADEDGDYCKPESWIDCNGCVVLCAGLLER